MSSFVSLESILKTVTAISLQIQQCRELESILQWTIDEIKALVQADRVLIYRVLERQEAIVIVESSSRGRPSMLGQRLDGPYFDATWIKRYKQEQANLIAGTQRGTIVTFGAEGADSLQANANLTVPLFNQDSLWGFLVVHPDRSLREWEALEVQYVQQVALQLGGAIQQAALRDHERATLLLRESEAALAAAQRIARMGNWSFDVSKGKITWSEGLFHLYGLDSTKPEPDLAAHIQLIHPDDRSQFQATVQHALETGEPYVIEFKAQRPDGSLCIVEGRGEAILNAQGEVVGLFGTAQDITDRKQKEELIRNIAQGISATVGDAFFQSLVQYLIRVLSMDQAFVHELIAPANEHVRIIAGSGKQQSLDGLEHPLQGTPCEQVIREGFCIYPDSIQQQFPDSTALQTLGGEGFAGIALVSSAGTTIGCISVISDRPITNVQFIQEVLTIFAVRAASELERQQSEAILRRYERIVSATPDCVSLVDRHYHYQVVNQTYLSWNQKAYDEIVGHSVSDLLGQDFFETFSKPSLDRCLDGEPQQSFETWQEYPDGQRRYIKATYTPYRKEPDSTVDGVVVNVHDLTDLKLAEEALRESEERFRQMATNIREVFWMTDIDFTEIIYVSPMYEEIWGRSRSQLYKRPRTFLEAIYPDDRAQVIATIEQQRHRGFSHEYRLRRPDGTIRWIWERAFPVADATGKPYRVVGVSQDVTDRKTAEIALQFSQAKFEALVANMPGMVYRYIPATPSAPHRFTFVSHQSYDLLELTPETLLQDADTFVNLIHTDDLPEFFSSVSYAVEHFLRWQWEGRIITPSGRQKWIQGQSQAVVSSEGAVWDGLLVDISARKAAETALRQQQQFTEQIAQSTLAILYVYDLVEQRNIYSNQQIETVLGYSADEIQTMGDALFPLLLHPDDLLQVMAMQQRLLQMQDDEFVETTYRMRHKTGGYRWLLSRDRVFSRTAEGVPRQTLGVATDITVLKDAQTSLQQQAERQRLLTVIAQRIRQTLDLDHILQTTVTEVRQFLQTDRVIIYQFEADWSGIVVAEAVADGWQSILGLQITDTYFVDTQGKAYDQGKVKATEDIYTAQLDACHIKLLEDMQVRAKLVVPILQDDRLWGLLVAQHCRSPRRWEALEIELQQQLATQIAIAIQQADLYRQSQLELVERQRAEAALQQLNQKLEHLNQMLEQRVQERTRSLHQQAEQERLLRVIIQNIHRSLDLDETLTAVLSETRQTLKADRVAVYQFNPDWSGSFIAESVGEGWGPLVGPDIEKVWEDTHLQETQGGRYRNNELFAVNDIYQSGHRQCHIDLLEQFQARAYAIAPIFVDEHLWGLLAAYQNSAPRVWQEWEMSLLKQLGMQTAIALRQSYLYQAIQAQVKELERLNQLKDDFLSTVSHELRSPMSSIKMAIQMLEISLEPSGLLGDAGNATNRYLKILREEVRREVNLINDLLDLARLDSGTELLTLTSIPLQAYLPHLAEPFSERTRQQQQQLVLSIPDDLPPFTTDLTFLERIVTELLHNACKYTPAGETITVSAQAIDTALELRITNTGVEIPAAECDRIFDKFYRIPKNDPWKYGGTGLGLALVKKLTERLNGHIHVESSQGQTTFVLNFEYRTRTT
ncbi:MAG: PAS domain-containing protein [Leptolyngbya sp. BL-A-14]